ncbi:hypothetical protein [Stenotrophomonas sp. MMGLT7]|uniref:hypothetical protein n=1 Tax=Stenotrophomonas sp. MMGLT7 TaxID=2901227 RepID=UPI001E43B7A4|nr:hypothetical protein [Stenotrophomonas sp. MMGLT7]MCD7097220.1 hypothetical protein [Stenotrophomonas sp. MMGLT7]
MKLRPFAVALVLMLAGHAASAETLLVQRVKERPAAVPARGLSMAEVESRFGAPQQKLDPRGGQKRQWPAIDRWVYPEFTVYFERQKVIDVVANQAHAGEIGPKPL